MDKDVTYLYHGKLAIKKNEILTIYDNMDRPRGHYGISEISEKKTNTVDFTYTWNLKQTNKQMNKHNKTETAF